LANRNIVDDYDAKTKGENVFDPRTVAKIHQNDDLDVSKDSHHHSIGPGSSQVASGNHNHDGVLTPQLLAGVTISGAKGGNIALASVVAALVTLGATDATTA